jgi:flagellar motor switch protein FliN
MADEPEIIHPEEIERLIEQVGAPGDTARQPAGAAQPPGAAGSASDIEALLGSAGGLLGQAGKPAVAKQPAAKERSGGGPWAGEGDLVPGDVEFLLSQAQRALESVDQGNVTEPPSGASTFRLEEFAGAPASSDTATLDLIRDVELDLKIELGRTHMYLEDVLKLRKGSVVPLDKLAGDPVDIFVNGRLIARGEVLVLNDNFCVRVAELIAGTGPVS